MALKRDKSGERGSCSTTLAHSQRLEISSDDRIVWLKYSVA
jgi:hypothetical protein